jgi:hypothetical protein
MMSSYDVEPIGLAEEMGYGSDAVDRDKVLRALVATEQALRSLRLALGYDAAAGSALPPLPDEGTEGIFDGENMVDSEGKVHMVPANYASKSKLVEGDPLKLFVTPDGRTIYKQLGPVARVQQGGTLRQDGSDYFVEGDDGKHYKVLTACVTYHMSLFGAQVGSRVNLVLPADREATWGVIDGVLA